MTPFDGVLYVMMKDLRLLNVVKHFLYFLLFFSFCVLFCKIDFARCLKFTDSKVNQISKKFYKVIMIFGRWSEKQYISPRQLKQCDKYIYLKCFLHDFLLVSQCIYCENKNVQEDNAIPRTSSRTERTLNNKYEKKIKMWKFEQDPVNSVIIWLGELL